MFKQWLLIILLALSTYLSRVLGVEFMAGRKMKPSLRLYFNYVPIAIISALIIGQILPTSNGQMVISIPVLVGSLVTAVTIRVLNMFLPSIIIGMAVGLMVRYLL